MKKLGMFYCLFFMICSCITNKKIYGNYQYKGVSNGFSKEYSLSIKKDSFDISHKSQDAYTNCAGKWKVFQDTLYLRCNEENVVTNMLSSGYMNKRDYKLKIISNQKLMMIEENMVLNKK